MCAECGPTPGLQQGLLPPHAAASPRSASAHLSAPRQGLRLPSAVSVPRGETHCFAGALYYYSVAIVIIII